MKTARLIAAAALLAVTAQVTWAAQPAVQTNPAMPHVVIKAKRMTDEEKARFDQAELAKLREAAPRVAMRKPG
ncbi:hypothetical protein E4K72_14595 [Oxalobacteraceae bacterium OM1]|nr:hypothetical protein E4K72_14595 [Oxalobacteraceae bacterium OM1]